MEDKILESLLEASRLLTISELNGKLSHVFANENINIIEGFYNNNFIYDLLKSAGTPEEFLGPLPGIKRVSGMLIQFLLIHYLLARDNPDITSINKLRDYIQENEQVKQSFMHWTDRSKFVVYLAKNNDQSWIDYANSCDGEWASVHLLDGSLPYCKANLNSLLHLVDRATEKNSKDLGIRHLGNNIKRKLQVDKNLRLELDGRMAEIFSNEHLKILLPSFVTGL